MSRPGLHLLSGQRHHKDPGHVIALTRALFLPLFDLLKAVEGRRILLNNLHIYRGRHDPQSPPCRAST